MPEGFLVEASAGIKPAPRARWARAAVLPLLLLAGSVHAQSGEAAPPAGKGAGPRSGAITHLELSLTNRADLTRLIQAGYDADTVRGNRVELYADNDELLSLSNGGWQINVLKPPAPGSTTPLPKALGDYNDYTNLTALLDGYATNFPSICRKVSIGQSVQHRELWAMKITTLPDTPADKPKFKYISTMHANEPLGTEMCLYLLDRLAMGYTSNDPRILNLVSNVEIWILPLMNPDGREANPPQRYNANGYDLNRSFPEGSSTNLGNLLYGPALATNGLQPEVGEVMAWTAAHHFSLGANFHTGDLVVNYPYDNDGLGSVPSPTPDDALAQALALTYSSNNPPMWSTPYFANGIVNGAAWYAISGGMQDWNYRYAGCLDMTIELANYEWPDPPASDIPTYWSQNQESMLAYMEWVLKGVRGLLRDAQSGQPIAGAVRVEGYSHLVFSDPAAGDYHRVLLPGTYTLWFYAPGYVAQRIPNVVVGSGNATRVDAALQPVSARFAAKISFRPSGTPVPNGYLSDVGGVFSPKAGAYSYGWETNLLGGEVVARNAGCSQDLRYDSFCQMQGNASHVWEIAVPDGPYSVLVAAGDPSATNGHYRILVENIPLLDGIPSLTNLWLEALGTVVVTNGRLTLINGAGAISNRLAFLEVSSLEPTTLAQWRAQFFGASNDTGMAAENADPDGDGLPNLLEYAFGLDPTRYDSGAQLSPVLLRTNDADWFGCWFPRNTNASDLTFSVQAASSLTPPVWTDVAVFTPASGWNGPAAVRETAAGPNTVAVTVLDTESLLTSTNRFLRLRVGSP